MEVQQLPLSTRENFSSDRLENGCNPSAIKGHRDSSVDSGIHPSSEVTRSPNYSVSDTDSEILEAFASLAPADKSGRLSTHETDNLVEEVYLAQHSLKDVKGADSVTTVNKVEDDGTYHASPYLLINEDELHFNIDSKLSENINNSEKEVEKNCMPLRNLKPEYIKDISRNVTENSRRHYVNQSELTPKVTRLSISAGLPQTVNNGVEVVVAVDLGTTYSGYAYCFTSHHFDKEVHMMRKWEGGDPGLNNQKIPTTLLVTPEGKFHSFGFTARDFYQDLEPEEADRWLFFDKFKKCLHNNASVKRDTKVIAANGKSVSALDIFSLALRYFSKLVMAELSDQGLELTPEKVRWVLTVPAIWSQAAKQLMREAAYKAEICSNNCPDSLIIALEPEAAAVWCKNLRFDQLEGKQVSKEHYQQSNQGSGFMMVDCGGGTVDVTVHKLHHARGPLKELYKASGEPCGSLGVDEEFDRLLGSVFGFPFMTRLRRERPAAYTELMLSFESRKRSILPSRSTSLNVSLPFSFIDFYQSVMGKKVEEAVRGYNHEQLSWSSQGMLRISPQLMTELFQPTIDNIVKSGLSPNSISTSRKQSEEVSQLSFEENRPSPTSQLSPTGPTVIAGNVKPPSMHVEGVLTVPEVSEAVKHVFLVGGFAESSLLQEAIRKKLTELKMSPLIIPQGVALCVLKGAVLYGLHPDVVSLRKAQHTYGFGIIKPFQRGIHPLEKLVVRENREWCVDVFDPLVRVNQNLHAGESVLRRYTPANPSQSAMVLHIYCTDDSHPEFVTDKGVQRVGTLKLDLTSELGRDKPREILTRLIFSSTELTVSAMDIETANYTDTSLNFLS